ncbi:MAG: hypothetical protein NT067_01120 [Candidatus Diapherotrites archaeon]|nr:hypothetical protein [Candidatus Diapherotrites archaeon]
MPVNWSASNAAFKQVADESYSQFIQGAEISSCSSQYSEQIVYPDTNNCQVSSTCSNSALNKIVSCAQKAGYSTSKTNARVVGIVQGSICPGTNILGFTTFSSVSVICTYADPGCAAHELGHTFYMCEQYCYNTGSSCWLPQNKTLNAIGGCKNYYPDGKTHCEEYGSLTTKCPEVKSGNIDCLGRKIPMGGQVGRSLMGPGLSSSIPRAFDCFETDTLKAALDCQ